MALLEVDCVSKHFGGLTALDDVSLDIAEGEIRGLIGPNGAGKSTLFKIIAGFYAPDSGDIRLNGVSIAGKKPHRVAGLGVVRTFQETTLFHELSVFDNVLIGCHLHARTNIFSALLGLDRARQTRAAAQTTEMIEFMGLGERQSQLAGELPLGSQRALALAIALASKPRLLLLDEPFAGMNAQETNQMMALTRRISESGVTIILVEHDMKAVMGLCEYLTVLNFGRLLAEGSPETVRANQDVVEAYLGGAA